MLEKLILIEQALGGMVFVAEQVRPVCGIIAVTPY